MSYLVLLEVAYGNCSSGSGSLDGDSMRIGKLTVNSC